MNKDTPGGTAELATEIQISHQRVHIWDLYKGGLDVHEIASSTGYLLHLIRVVLRGAPPGETHR